MPRIENSYLACHEFCNLFAEMMFEKVFILISLKRYFYHKKTAEKLKTSPFSNSLIKIWHVA